MSHAVDTTTSRSRWELRFWRGLAALLFLVALASVGARSGLPNLQAQQTRRPAEERAGRSRLDFRQVEVNYTRTAETIAEWESKGWDTYQVIPVYPANLGAGGPMTVALVFRRPNK